MTEPTETSTTMQRKHDIYRTRWLREDCSQEADLGFGMWLRGVISEAMMTCMMSQNTASHCYFRSHADMETQPVYVHCMHSHSTTVSLGAPRVCDYAQAETNARMCLAKSVPVPEDS
jgi:hypothetical protein